MWKFNYLIFINISLIFDVMSVQVTLYGPKNVKPKKMFISSHCQKIPKEISANLRFVYTTGECILLWEDENCKVNSIPIVTKESENMPALNFEDLFSSISDCSKSQSQFKASSKNSKNEFNSQNYDYNPGEDEFIENLGENGEIDSDSISKLFKNKIKDEVNKGFGWFKNKIESKIDKLGK